MGAVKFCREMAKYLPSARVDKTRGKNYNKPMTDLQKLENASKDEKQAAQIDHKSREKKKKRKIASLQ